jgi:hypothetical protein
MGISEAQVFKGEIIGGANISQVDGDYMAGYRKWGAHVGIGVMFPFHFKKNEGIKPWALSMEILYSQKGARQRNFSKGDDTSLAISSVKFTYLLKLDYVSIPFLLHYNDKDRWMFALGFAYNRMIRLHEMEFDVVQTYDTVKRFRPDDFTVLADVRIRIWQQLKFGVRFEYSMASLRKRYFYSTPYSNYKEGNREQYNNSLSFYLVYMLNEKKQDYKKTKQEPTNKIYYY